MRAWPPAQMKAPEGKAAGPGRSGWAPWLRDTIPRVDLITRGILPTQSLVGDAPAGQRERAPQQHFNAIPERSPPSSVPWPPPPDLRPGIRWARSDWGGRSDARRPGFA